jgi:hypothetical protein
VKELGANLDSEGMKETPLRAAKALVEMTEGSRTETDQLTTMFKAECQTAICHDMVIVEGIREKWDYVNIICCRFSCALALPMFPTKRYWAVQGLADRETLRAEIAKPRANCPSDSLLYRTNRRTPGSGGAN